MATETPSERPTRPCAPAHGTLAKRRLRKALQLRTQVDDLRKDIARTIESFDVVKPVCSAEERAKDGLVELYLSLETADARAVQSIDDFTQAVTFACGEDEDDGYDTAFPPPAALPGE